MTKEPYWTLAGHPKKYYDLTQALIDASYSGTMGVGNKAITYHRMIGSLWVSTERAKDDERA